MQIFSVPYNYFGLVKQMQFICEERNEMFEYLMTLVIALTKVFVNKGLKFDSINVVSNDCVMVNFKTFDDNKKTLSVGTHADDEDTVIIEFGNAFSEITKLSYAHVVFRKSHEIKFENIISSLFAILPSFEKMEEVKSPNVSPLPTIQKHYYFYKKCEVCSTVYYSKVISYEEYANLADNEHIEMIVGPVECIAQITSKCDKCAN